MHYSFRLTFSALLASTIFFGWVTVSHAQLCADQTPRTSGSHSFRQQGERFDIPLNLGDCQASALELRWSNGRNNGSLFHVTFFDGDNQAIYSKDINGFLTGSFQFPFMTPEPQPWLGSQSLISVPVKVTVEAARPFASPATISYRVTRVATHAVTTSESNFVTNQVEKIELVEAVDGKTPKRPLN